MADVTVTLMLDEALVARAGEKAELGAVINAALRQYLDYNPTQPIADRRWAEDNALAIEAVAGGAEEAKARSQ